MAGESKGYRSALAQAKKIVLKVGTRVLVDSRGRPSDERFKALVDQIAELTAKGITPVLVTSGAVGAGMQALGWTSRPTDLHDLQMAAAVGQSRLMSRYEALFARHGLVVGQVLLTADDLKNRTRHLNARNTLNNLLRHGVIPIINENDVVSVNEIKVGDNDMLAALTSILVDADLLVLLTTTNGLKRMGVSESGRKTSKRIAYLERVTRDTLKLAGGKGSDLSTGGMASKLQAAALAARAGVCVVIADGRIDNTIGRLMNGDDVGTLIGAADNFSVVGDRGKKRWLAFFHRTRGAIVIDDGAVRALEERQKSLLPVGVVKVEGNFGIGELVSVRCRQGRLIARGLTEFDSELIQKVKGKKTGEIVAVVGINSSGEVIHRDNLVILRSKHGDVA